MEGYERLWGIIGAWNRCVGSHFGGNTKRTLSEWAQSCSVGPENQIKLTVHPRFIEL